MKRLTNPLFKLVLNPQQLPYPHPHPYQEIRGHHPHLPDHPRRFIKTKTFATTTSIGLKLQIQLILYTIQKDCVVLALLRKSKHKPLTKETQDGLELEAGSEYENKQTYKAPQMNAYQIAQSRSAHFKDRQYGGEFDGSISTCFRDFDRFTKQINLNENRKAVFFISTVIEPERTFLSSNTTDQMDYKNIVYLDRLTDGQFEWRQEMNKTEDEK